MNKELFFFLVCFLTLSYFSSCTKSDEADSSFSALNLEFYEQFSSEGREFVFFLETHEQFPCSNFLIKTQVNETKEYLEVFAEKIDIPNTCVTSLGPATQKLVLGKPEIYSKRISFWINDNRHDFHFDVNNSTTILKKHNQFGEQLTFSRDTLFRLPDNCVWGYIVEQNKNESNILDELIDSFTESGAINHFLAQGDYHFFRVDDSGNIRFPGIGAGVLTFSVLFDQNLQVLIDIIQEMAPDLQIRMFNTNGMRYMPEG